MIPIGSGAWIRGSDPFGWEAEKPEIEPEVGPGSVPRRRRRGSGRSGPPLDAARAWVTKPPRPLLGDVRVRGSGGRGGGAATTTEAASSAAAFAGGRADVRGGGAPGAERLGACGPLVAAAATPGDRVSGEGPTGPHGTRL
ncbi:Hypothetical predicted protein [Marmota monax]|uniref:Uncharacterized protein n=1 Tax=Marmota monax TaxID=9995 RepID=A0A5E4C1A7_MARMO|nr:Hypothetical predicted protein [Marmota monax]